MEFKIRYTWGNKVFADTVKADCKIAALCKFIDEIHTNTTVTERMNAKFSIVND